MFVFVFSYLLEVVVYSVGVFDRYFGVVVLGCGWIEIGFYCRGIFKWGEKRKFYLEKRAIRKEVGYIKKVSVV